MKRLFALSLLIALAAGEARAETQAYSGAVAAEDFFRFIEEHSGDAVRLTAEGEVPADRLERTEDAVFFWYANVQVGIEPSALQDDKLAIDGCYRVRLAEMRQGVTAYYLDPSADCE